MSIFFLSKINTLNLLLLCATLHKSYPQCSFNNTSQLPALSFPPETKQRLEWMQTWKVLFRYLIVHLSNVSAVSLGSRNGPDPQLFQTSPSPIPGIKDFGFVCEVLWIKLRTLHILSKGFTNELYPQPCLIVLSEVVKVKL